LGHVGNEHSDVVTPDIVNELGGQWYSHGGPIQGMSRLDSVLGIYSTASYNHKQLRAKVSSSDAFLYIYTR